jgi:ribulose-5-phosphate 4-epimerase/fuculose-1-phosphate aldolase
MARKGRLSDPCIDGAFDVVAKKLILANHILARHGVLDAFGHVSARHPEKPDAFIISKSMAPATVGYDDLMEINLEGEPISKGGLRPFLERFIHSSIYLARPDVGAIVHCHTPTLVSFGAVPNASLRPIFHMAGFIGAKAPVFEIRDSGNLSSDMLISTPKLGGAVADCLGGSSVVLMRGHGATCVGETVEEAVFRAIYLVVNAQIQHQATQLGTPTFLNADEASGADAVNRSQVNRAWALWCSEVAE